MIGDKSMRILVVGSGGREHTLVWKLAQSSKVTQVFCAPGNGGTANVSQNVALSATQIEALATFVQDQRIDLTVVGPELPLTLGIVDYFTEKGLNIIGPTKGAAQLEGSKIFAKDFMNRHNVPTANYLACESYKETLASIRCNKLGYPLVIKADGLAAGKGVVITQTMLEAESVVRQMMQDRIFGKAGEKVLLEEHLEGEEVSFMIFSDGDHILPMVPSQDHKRVFDNDQGPNTGGMGAYSTDAIIPVEQHQTILKTIVEPTIQGMAIEGTPYKGILYFGLMVTKQGIKVLEYNVRMGDPETQPVLYRLKSDLVDIFQGIYEEDLKSVEVTWDPGSSVCVVLASKGYPGEFETGNLVTGISDAEATENINIFHAGTSVKNDQIHTNGGRVLGVTGKSTNLSAAVNQVYQAIKKVRFSNMHYRLDIGSKGLVK